MKVHDIDSEMSCVKNLILIKDTLSECTKVLHKNSTQKESGSPNSHFFLTFNELYQNIICLCDFASIYPFSRYGIEYSFQNFSSKHIGEKLNIICFKLDMPDLANRISLGWHIKDTDHREKYALTCFSLGKYDTGLVYSPNRRRSTSETSAKQSEAFSMKLIDMFSRSFIYEIEMIAYLSQTFNILPFLWEFSENGVPGTIPNQAITNDLLPSTQHHYFSPQHKAGTRRVSRSGSKVSFSLLPELAQVKAKKSYIAPDIGSKCDFTSPHFYKRLLAISNTEMTFYPSVESNKMLRHFLKNYSKIGDQVNYFVSCGNFEKAFKYMSEMTTPQAKWTLFFDNIIFSAYSFNYESRMKYRIIESDPTMKEYGSYLEKLLSFSLKNKMPHLQLDLEMLLERSETAAITAIELSKKSSNLKESLSFLEIASNALNLELSGKKKKSKIPNKISIENL
ncbi:hypothetical protein TRFO_13449 [Tritrichomonas foetus]|uniref:Uncharacterized protein n=1 Tax=Tritrichomonas foetus TaxID=1144522 RepID=A0A1J4KXZ9_9EUKA|nr:hypothetical protein TRFO_13449 [Tritrichomonas foetus]|eukprot:OHT16123.1 hypothetical protein TRFO_13449 [Tritrichomonas foetus]